MILCGEKSDKTKCMGKNIQLSIAEPCHEDWNKMTPVEQGRFCGSCQTRVVDFTSMSDAEVIAFFKRPSTGSVCGRMMNEQLERDMIIPVKRIPWVRYFFQLVIPAFLVSTKAAAQGQVRVGTSVIERGPVRGKVVCYDPGKNKPEHMISGSVLNGEEEGIPGIIVTIMGTNSSGITDRGGNFKITYTGTERKITLIATGTGFEPLQKSIRLGKKPKSAKQVELVLAKQDDIIVTVGYMEVER